MLALTILLSAAMAQEGARKPVVWAVIVGIDDYEDAAIADCRGAVAEARELRRALVRAGWDGDQMLLLTDGSSREHGPADRKTDALAPTRENLQWAWSEWLPYRARPGDLVLFAYAGQAAPVRSESETESRARLLPIDANREELDATSWSLEGEMEALASRGQNPLLVWLDTAPAGRGQPAFKTDEVADPDRWLRSLTRWPGTSVWLAATRGVAREGDANDPLGPFAKGLIDGLGNPDESRNLLACLHTLNRDPALAAQGFRSLGGLPPDLTLWKSRLDAQTHPEPSLLLQQGHADRVTTVLFTADGRMITAGMDSTIRFWRTTDRVLLRTLSAHTIGVTALAISPDGRRLVSGDGAGRIWIWDLATYEGQTPRGPSPHASAVQAIAFLPDGRRFVTLGQSDGRLLLWESGAEDPRPKPILNGASALAVGEDGFAVAAAPVIGEPSVIHLFDAEGKVTARLAGPGGVVAHGRLALSGDRVAAADNLGGLIIGNRKVLDGDPIRLEFGAPVRFVRDAGEQLAVGVGREVRLIPIEASATAQTLTASGPVIEAIGSENGHWLAALTGAGAVHIWELDHAEARAVFHQDTTADHRAVSAAFLPRGEAIAVGEQSGMLRAWALPNGAERFAIEAHRGKIDVLAVSTEGRFLLQLTHDWKARVWDLQAGRSLVVVPGEWTSGAFLPDGRLALTSREGNVVLVDRESGRRLDTTFAKPEAEGGRRPIQLPFGHLAVAPDGHRIAAATPGGEVACVWKTEGGAPEWVGRTGQTGISAVAFSGDSRHLLTAGLDARAVVWDLEDPAWRERPKWSYRADDPENLRPGGEISAAAIAPDRPWRIATGQRDGRFLLWDTGPDGRLHAEELAKFDGEVKAAAFTPDGQRLIAAGADKTVRLWDLGQRRPLAPATRLTPQHDEQVNALAVWPDGAILASGSDDTSVRFWGLDQARAGEPLVGSIIAKDDGAWVAFTPNGLFDSSPGAESRVTWLVEGQVLPLEQYYGARHRFQLADHFRHGDRLKAPPANFNPPILAIDPPLEATGKLETTLSIALGTAKPEGLRLYRDGLPVRAEEDFEAVGPGHYRVRVRLRPGENTFYVMAGPGESGTVDGRSNTVAVRCQAPVVPGRTHILAIGVSDYDRNALKFADRDAVDLARILGTDPVRLSAEPGLTRILKNDEVTVESVRSALREIRDAARPDDLVIVFLAGHADVRRDDRFCLLLHDFPFATTAPLTLANRGVIQEAPDREANRRDERETALPFSEIYRVLARLDARERLVVIDACQAGAIFEDPLVQRIRERCDDGAHQARTSYLLATRAGELASESAALGHGLFTHVLLHGLGTPGLATVPGGLPDLGDADLDDDQTITTEELGQYATAGVPRLAARLEVAQRQPGSEDRPGSPPAVQAVVSPGFPIARAPIGSE